MKLAIKLDDYRFIQEIESKTDIFYPSFIRRRTIHKIKINSISILAEEENQQIRFLRIPNKTYPWPTFYMIWSVTSFRKLPEILDIVLEKIVNDKFLSNKDVERWFNEMK